MNPKPIPKYIEEGALRRAQARHAAAKEARENPQAVVERIKAAAAAANMKPKAYIESLAEDQEKLTPAEGTQPISAFWSHGVRHEDAPLNKYGEPFLDQRFIAEEWAAQRNKDNPGAAQTLETTQGGRELDEMFLWEPRVLKALGGARKGFGPNYASERWGAISETYAKAAAGRVVVFGQTPHTLSILHREELGALCNNPNVGLRNIHFAYEPDQKWPEVTRAEAGTDAVRAVAQFNDPTLPRYIDPQGFAAAAPEVRKAQIDKITEAVAPAQAEAEAVKAPELQAPPKSVRTPLWQVGFKPPRTTTRPATAGPASGTGPGPAAGPPLAPRPLATGTDGPA